jgi:hypothetical protein
VQDHSVALAIVERDLSRERAPLEHASLELVRRILEGRRAAHVERLRWQWKQIKPHRFGEVVARM